MIKPFLIEEFYCRITQNIEMTEYVRETKEASNKDYLTKLYNRRYLLESGLKFHAESKAEALLPAFSIAMVDIDDFRKINDMYGHDAGDSVLKKVSTMLQERFGDSDIVSRFGGDEFCILAAKNTDPKHTLNTFEALRKDIEQSVMNAGHRNIHITVSIGVCAKLSGSLEMMIKQADTMLCEAKSAGKNRVLSLSDDNIMTAD